MGHVLTQGIPMNLFQSHSDATLTELNSQLSEFGLHPKEWSLIKDSNFQIKIQNKNHDSFYFMGSIKKQNGKKLWKNIQLISL